MSRCFPDVLALTGVFVMLAACGSSNSTGTATGPQGPSAVSVTPGSGNGTTATFTAKFSDPKGPDNLTQAGVLFNDGANGARACYAIYAPPGNSLFLVKDSGAGSDVLDLSKGGSAENSQCTLEAAGSAIAVKGNELTLTLRITFKPGFKGHKNIYLYVENKDGAKTGLQTPLGGWDVT
jgi:hypothetical protein